MEMDVPLARQVDLAMQQMEEELKGLSAGTIVLQVRNDTIGKFGIRHLPVDIAEKKATADSAGGGLTADQVKTLRQMAVDAMARKRSWTHGEITYDFVLRQGKLYLSVTFESNYNMANVLFRLNAKRRDRRDISNE
ncbi:O-methyltransferase [Cohnella sp. REN36]|uniref:O-methyltransferase n=1 Tax=Cohnella sp. REN36 TaxID=2887347 RepID=UPI001D15CD65|nr:O-methyltransferase [Cohnella sp. REN36]MCC3377491.1 O-methyltransferase [Cohnella sp. REN36]